MAPKFAKAGIEVVTIGTDDIAEIKAAHQAALENGTDPLHFEVLCDPKGSAFRRWGVWDEFTDEALHGTFLVDAGGRILWQDISAQPFEETDFLLAECVRLLAAWR
ncbi:MAG: redoxin domain-containing protein [Planctomycetes bacterium]|nr:redoxin domain-containing protein [Planctomycetota bacterium]